MVEAPLTTWQFLQLTGLLGAPVHAALVLGATFLLRYRRRAHWAVLVALAPVWLASSVALQAVMWATLPDLPERIFMVFGFINGHAVVGAIAIMAALWAVDARRHPSGLASSA